MVEKVDLDIVCDAGGLAVGGCVFICTFGQ